MQLTAWRFLWFWHQRAVPEVEQQEQQGSGEAGKRVMSEWIRVKGVWQLD